MLWRKRAISLHTKRIECACKSCARATRGFSISSDRRSSFDNCCTIVNILSKLASVNSSKETSRRARPPLSFLQSGTGPKSLPFKSCGASAGRARFSNDSSSFPLFNAAGVAGYLIIERRVSNYETFVIKNLLMLLFKCQSLPHPWYGFSLQNVMGFIFHGCPKPHWIVP